MGFHKQNFNCLSRGGRNILKIPKSLINVVGFKIIANSFFRLEWQKQRKGVLFEEHNSGTNNLPASSMEKTERVLYYIITTLEDAVR